MKEKESAVYTIDQFFEKWINLNLSGTVMQSLVKIHQFINGAICVAVDGSFGMTRNGSRNYDVWLIA